MHAELLGCGLTVEGQLGVRNSEPNVSVPDRIIGAPNDADGSAVKQVACGENHTIFLTNDGKMWSVGGNFDGQLGRGTKVEGSFSIYPVSVTSGTQFIQVAAGRAHSLAVADDGRVFAWGSNEHGQLGHPSNIQRIETPKRIATLTEVVQVAVGSDHCIALTDAGNVFIWGEQADGKCVHEPKFVEELLGVPIVRVAAGSRHCVAITASGSVYTWGLNDYGQLGFENLRPCVKPFHLSQMDGSGVVEAACGDRHTVLLTHCGRLFAFGCDSLGQCGFEKKIEKRTTPTAIPELIGSHVTRVAAGRCHTIAVVGGYVYPFGLNSSGQLGNGSLRTQGSPRRIDDLNRVVSVFAGWDQTFFLRSNKLEERSIVGPNSMIKYPQKLTAELVKSTLKYGEKLDFIGLIETVFTSLNCINSSFLFEDERKYSVGEEQSHGVDLDSVMESFMLISNSSHSRQYEELIMESAIRSLDCKPSDFQSIECMRIYLILPWLSSFTEHVTSEVIDKLHDPFAKHICGLTEKMRNVLEKWWSKLQVRHFRRVVAVMKVAVRTMLKLKKTPFDCRFYLHMLTKLNLINKKTHMVPIEYFYIDDLNSLIDIKMDYYNWVINAQQNMSPNYWSSFPFLLNGEAKGDLLHMEAIILQQLRVQDAHIQTILGTFLREVPVLEIHVRRDFIVSDTMNQMANITPNDLQKPLKVRIHGEEADDAGGVRKEFFMIVMQKILQPQYGMFIEDETSHLIWFSGLPPPFCEREQFRQLGRLVGLSIYNRVLVPFPFPLALYKYLLDQKPTLEDLCELSPVEGNSLQSLLEYEGDDVEQVFSLNFCISFNVLGETKTVEMVPNGEKVVVSNENRQKYVDLYVRHRMELGADNEIEKQAGSFRQGFLDALHSRILSFFQPRELMELVVGNENYDWNLFREIVKYIGEYHANHPAIQAFWKAFFQLDDSQKKKFLQFLSGSTRLPIAGMSALDVTIQPSSAECLPVAHTCFNLLDLPNISDSEEILRRLLISNEHTEGFTLV